MSFAADLQDALASTFDETGWTQKAVYILGDRDGNLMVPEGQRVGKGYFWAHRMVDGDAETIQICNSNAAITWSSELETGTAWVIGKPPGSGDYHPMIPHQFRNSEWYGGALGQQVKNKINEMVTVDRIQFLRLVPTSDTGLQITVTSGVIRYGDTWYFVPRQTIANLSGYAPATGKAKWVSVAWDIENEQAVITDGTEYDTASLPVWYSTAGGVSRAIPDGCTLLGGVKLYDGQTALDLHADIIPIVEWVSVGGGTTVEETVVVASGGTPCEGRLSGGSTPNTAVGGSNTTGTIYYHPYVGNKIALYVGGVINTYTFDSLSVTVAAAGVYDIFAYYTGSAVALEATAWTDTTTRATSVQKIASGLWVKAGSYTRRYLGTVYVYEVSSAYYVTDSATRRHVWNAHNRIHQPLSVVNPATSWILSDNAIVDWTGTARTVSAVKGLGEEALELNAVCSYLYSGADDGRVYLLWNVNGDDVLVGGASNEAVTYTPASFDAGGDAIHHAHASGSWVNEGLYEVVLQEYFNSSIASAGTDSVTGLGEYTDGLVKAVSGVMGYLNG